MSDQLNTVTNNQRLIAEAQANLGPTNTLIQQAFLNVDARQAASFSASSSTVINPTVIYATGGNGGPKPPPPPGAGAVKMTSNMLPPNMQIPEASTFIGTPRRQPGERAPRGERSRSASVARGRPRSIKPIIPEIEVTPVNPTTPSIKNIGMEEIRVKREASVKAASSEPPKAKSRPKPKAIAKATSQLIVADAEPAKKREAEDILGAAAKKKYIEKEEEVNVPPPTKSKKGAPPPDSSAAASSSGSTPKPKAKPKGRPKKEPVDASAAEVSKGEKYDKEKGKALSLIALMASLRRAMSDGELVIADEMMLERKITEFKMKPGRPAVNTIKSRH